PAGRIPSSWRFPPCPRGLVDTPNAPYRTGRDGRTATQSSTRSPTTSAQRLVPELPGRTHLTRPRMDDRLGDVTTPHQLVVCAQTQSLGALPTGRGGSLAAVVRE